MNLQFLLSRLRALADVVLSSVADGHVLRYRASDQKWINTGHVNIGGDVKVANKLIFDNASVSQFQDTYILRTGAGMKFFGHSEQLMMEMDGTGTITCYEAFVPSADNTLQLGSEFARWTDGWFAGAVTAGVVKIPGGGLEGGFLAWGPGGELADSGYYASDFALTNDLGGVTFLKRVVSGVVALIDGATIATTAVDGNTFRITLGGNRTFLAPIGGASAQRIVYVIRQDATGSRTATWNAIFRFPGGVAPVLTTTAGKTDYVEFVYNATDAKWDNINSRLNL